ncbi:hypothetical protein [Lapidilactobacillus wuchangensis]|uniref:hypothetical protein n=1 Tax=Lapidilactobacillus wuchangensis TaxID=2486001 RepID=UPI000F775CF9|nr:hypothetical protein [Lapidilactobacillus wuchangensis]
MRKITRYCVLALAILGLSTNLVGCANNSHHSAAIKTAQVTKIPTKKQTTKKKVSKATKKTATTKTDAAAKVTKSVTDSQTAAPATKYSAPASNRQQISVAAPKPSSNNANTGIKQNNPATISEAEQFRQALIKQLPNKYSLAGLYAVPDEVITAAMNQTDRQNLDAVGEIIAEQYPKVLLAYTLYSTPQEFRLGIVKQMPGVYLLSELEKVPDSVVWSAVQTAGAMGGDLGTIGNIIDRQYPQVLVNGQAYLNAETDRHIIFDEMPGYYSWSELEKIADDVVVRAVCATAKMGGDPGVTGQMLAKYYPSIILKNDNHALAESYRQTILAVNGSTHCSAAELAKIPDGEIIDATYGSINIGSDPGYSLSLLAQDYPNVKITNEA